MFQPQSSARQRDSGSTAVDTPPDGRLRPQEVADELALEMAQRWERGDRVPAETLLVREPWLSLHAEAAVRLIYEELCLAQEAGLGIRPADLLRRFPQWQKELQVLLECHKLLQPTAHEFPAVGESLGGFRLLAELGRGAQSRVYLATEPLLAGRLVVLKVAPLEGEEHLLLSALQHAHVVPLYCIADEPERGLRAFCMPYLGGATLDQVLSELRKLPLPEWSGRTILEILDRHRSPLLPAESFEGPARRLMERLSYCDAIAWMAACLADALAHVHERGLVHLDLKPSNVLIAADGQPMLLDFHLARPAIATGERVRGKLGGTPGYISPEQEAIFTATREQRSAPLSLDGRSDHYSLALVLNELLTDLDRTVVPSGMTDMISRCLSVRADRRYPDARALADDFRRHLKNQPLAGVANRWPERWRKWRRRRPTALAMGAMLAVVLVAATTTLVVGGMHLRQAQHEAEQALVDAVHWREAGQYEVAALALKQGSAAAARLPFGGDLREQLERELEHVQEARRSHELAAVVDWLRPTYAVRWQSGREQAELAQACRALWARRADLTPRTQNPTSSTERESRETLCELGLLWADLRSRLGDEGAKGESLVILAEAEESWGPNVVIEFEALRHSHQPPDTPLAGIPQSAWEHWALGRALCETGECERALTHLSQGAELAPQQLWPHFYRAHCAYRMGRFAESLAEAGICIALSPQRAENYNQRGLARAALRDWSGAELDFGRALQHDPNLGISAFNRAGALVEAGRFDEARRDLGYATSHGVPEAAVRKLVSRIESEHDR